MSQIFKIKSYSELKQTKWKRMIKNILKISQLTTVQKILMSFSTFFLRQITPLSRSYWYFCSCIWCETKAEKIFYPSTLKNDVSICILQLKNKHESQISWKYQGKNTLTLTFYCDLDLKSQNWPSSWMRNWPEIYLDTKIVKFCQFLAEIWHFMYFYNFHKNPRN